MVKKISIYGSGAFGFVLARHLGNKFLDNSNYKIYLYGRNKKIIRSIAQTKKHPLHFDDVFLPQNVIQE